MSMNAPLGSQVAGSILAQTRRRWAATIAYFQALSGEAETHMKDKATWVDRTGLARAGLAATVAIDQTEVAVPVLQLKGKNVSTGTVTTGQRQVQLDTTPGKQSVALVLSHGVAYGVWLEVSNGGQHAIVGPTAELMRARVAQGMRRIWPS